MARATRIALDMALVSMARVRPFISRLWLSAKSSAENSPMRPLVDNALVTKVERKLGSIATMLASKIANLRDQQLPQEKQYLEKELQMVNKKLQDSRQGVSSSLGSGEKAAGKFGQHHGSIAWQYLKVESVPPMTMSIFNGPVGDKLETAVSGVVNGFIKAIESKIQNMDANAERVIREKEAAILAAQEAAKAEELKKRKDAELKAVAAKMAKDEEAAKKKAKEEKKKEEVKKDPPKTDPKKK